MPDNPPTNCESIQITDVRAFINQLCDRLVAHPEITFIVTRKGKPAAILQALPGHWQGKAIFARPWQGDNAI